MWALAPIVFALMPSGSSPALAPDGDDALGPARVGDRPAGSSHKDIRKLLHDRAARTALLQTQEGRDMMIESGTELQKTFESKSPWANDNKQKDKINKIIAGNNYLERQADAYTGVYNLYSQMFADMKTNFEMQSQACTVWREESRHLWRDLKRKMTKKLESYQGTEEAALRRIFDELYLTYSAIGSLFKYNTQKMQWVKQSLSKKQQELYALDKQYTDYVMTSTTATEKELDAAITMLNEKTMTVMEFYDVAIHNGYNSLQKVLIRDKDKQAYTVKFLDQIMFDGGAREGNTPKEKEKNDPDWQPAKEDAKTFWERGSTGDKAKQWPLTDLAPYKEPKKVVKAPKKKKKGGFGYHMGQAFKSLFLENGTDDRVVDYVEEVPEKAVAASKLALGFAVQAYDTVADELKNRRVHQKLQQRRNGRPEPSLTEQAAEATELEGILQQKGGKSPPPPPPPPIIPALEPLLEGTQERAEKVVDLTEERTTGINDKIQLVERQELARDKEFTQTMAEVQRLTMQDSDRKMAGVDRQWEGMLLKHERTLKELETDLYAAVQSVSADTKQNFALGNAVTQSAKKLHLRQLAEVRRSLKQVERKVAQVLIDTKTQAGQINVDIVKAQSKMDTSVIDKQQSAKKIEKTEEASIKSRFNDINQEIQAAVTNDIHQVDQVKTQLEGSVDSVAIDGKASLEALKKEIALLDAHHDAMFSSSEAWIQGFNDQLLALGNNIQKFARSSLKDSQKMEYDLARKRQQNVDALTVQERALGAKTNEVTQMIAQSKQGLLGEQDSLWTKAQKALGRKMDGDARASDIDESNTGREMNEAQAALDRSSRRHTTALKVVQEQLDAVSKQMPTATSEVNKVEAAVAAFGAENTAKREKVQSTFEKNVQSKFDQGLVTQKAQISLDTKNAEREMGATQAAFQTEADAALKDIEGVKSGVGAAMNEFKTKESQAQSTVERVSANEKTVTKAITGEFKAVSRAAAADEDADQKMREDQEEFLVAQEKKLHDYANSILNSVSAPAQTQFKGELRSREDQINAIIASTQETFTQKEALIQAVNFQVITKLEELAKEAGRTTAQLENVAAQEQQTRAAADLAEQHAGNAAAEEAELAAKSTEELDAEREDRMQKYQRQVRKQGHFASKQLDLAIGKVSEDAEAEIQAIRDAEHMTEREKKRKIQLVEEAAEKAVAQMAQTEASAGRELSAFELISSKWGSDLAAHLGDLEEAMQAEELQRARKLARSKRDLADMSARFHESVKTVKDHLLQAQAEGKIVLSPEEIAGLHEMEARAHADLQMHEQDAQKEQRVAELLEQKIERSGEMSQGEIDRLEQKLSLLTGTTSAGVSSLRSRTMDVSKARDEALRAQNHFAAASVGESLSAVSQMAEFLVAGTRVSGLKQEALDRQQNKLRQVLISPLADLQEELGIKTKKLEENENKIEGYSNEAKKWATSYASSVSAQKERAKDAMDSAQKNYASMGSRVSAELDGVSKSATQAMVHGMDEIDKEAAFDAKKAENDLAKVAAQNDAFGDELEHRAQKSLNIATDEANRIKADEYERFVALDASDTQLAGAIEQLNHKSADMIAEAQKMSARVTSAVNSQMFAAEQKRAKAGSELARLNADVAAASGNDPGLASAAVEITSSLEHSDVSDKALEQLAAEIEQHNARDAAATAKAEQVNADVRKKMH